MQQENRLITLFRENPILILLGICVLAASILVVAVSNNRQADRTDGDIPSPDSAAFTLYKGEAYRPFDNNRTDNFIRADLAFFARQTMPEYDPNTNPGVVFEVKEYNKENDKKLTMKGKYEKASGDVAVVVERMGYDRVKVSITRGDTNIDKWLPSASKRNAYIATLPVEQPTYQLDYSPEADTFIITLTSLAPGVEEQARAVLAHGLGNDYEADKIIINYPAFLKGEPRY